MFCFKWTIRLHMYTSYVPLEEENPLQFCGSGSRPVVYARKYHVGLRARTFESHARRRHQSLDSRPRGEKPTLGKL